MARYFNFNVQNDSDETLTITGKTTDPACGFTAGFDPPDEQGVTSNGGKGHFSFTGEGDIHIKFILGFDTGKVDCCFIWNQYETPTFTYDDAPTIQVSPPSPVEPNIQGKTATVALSCASV